MKIIHDTNIIHLPNQISSPKLQDSLGCFKALYYKVCEQVYVSSHYTITAPTLHEGFILVF
jgi:hypothetical protein